MNSETNPHWKVIRDIIIRVAFAAASGLVLAVNIWASSPCDGISPEGDWRFQLDRQDQAEWE